MTDFEKALRNASDADLSANLKAVDSLLIPAAAAAFRSAIIKEMGRRCADDVRAIVARGRRHENAFETAASRANQDPSDDSCDIVEIYEVA
jgi:hypothetical protein